MLTCALAAAALACGEDSTQPDALRFGQVGEIEAELDVPLVQVVGTSPNARLGVGRLHQTLTWRSSGAWFLREAISYRDLTGDADLRRTTGDPSQYVLDYASLIIALNDIQGQKIVGVLSDTIPPDCGLALSRITFTIRDEPRDESRTWVRCVHGSLATLTQEDAEPADGARLALATELMRNATVGTGFASTYAGSVPFGTLDRGDQSDAPLTAPEVFTDQASFSHFWAEHAPDRPRPDVDFSLDMVIAGIVGPREEAGDSVEVRRVLQVDQGTLIEVVERVPGNFCSPAALVHTPYHIVVAPLTPAPIRFADIRVDPVDCGS
ncbi:MAG: hypothetical protein PVJ02_14540 [Gemmatimonadota bacterium]